MLSFDPSREKIVIDIIKEEALKRKEPTPDEPLGMLPTSQYPRRTFRRPDEAEEINCIWSRRWNFTFKDYRVWFSGGLLYNGTRFDNVTYSGVNFFEENLGIAKGNNTVTEIIEPFDANALPMTGAVSFSFNKVAGTGTLTTPFGSYPLAPPFVFISGLGQRWFGSYQFRNYSFNLLLKKPDEPETTTFNCLASPYWVGYNNFFKVSRNGAALLLEGVNITQDFSQLFDYVDGGYVLPDPAPCSEANAHAEAARAAFAAEFDSYLHISDIVFGAMTEG